MFVVPAPDLENVGQQDVVAGDEDGALPEGATA
jgi:hypothetical protein